VFLRSREDFLKDWMSSQQHAPNDFSFHVECVLLCSAPRFKTCTQMIENVATTGFIEL